MSDRRDQDGASPHVFDQTNGVLGAEPEEQPDRREAGRTPPRTFGIPPVTSL